VGRTRAVVYDNHTPGLGLVTFPSGVRSFFYQKFVRGRPERQTIGRFPEVSVEQARGKASQLGGKVSDWKLRGCQGESPFVKNGDPTLGYLFGQYLEKHIRTKASNPDKAANFAFWQFGAYLEVWRERKIGSITKTDVNALHDKLKNKIGEHTANRTVQFIRAIVNFAKKHEMWDGANPASGVSLFHEEQRTRYLQPGELPQFFAALKHEETNADLRDFVTLAMWTGARRSDVLSMRWENLYLDDNYWQVPHPKNRKPYPVPLTPEAIDILRARYELQEETKRKRLNEERSDDVSGDIPWVFPSRGRSGHIVDLKNSWGKLLKRANLPGVRLRQHDLRRTLGSYQAAQGTNLKIIGESLGHKNLASTQPYAQYNLQPIRDSVMSATRTMIAASKKKPKVLALPSDGDRKPSKAGRA
jgi:integrase